MNNLLKGKYGPLLIAEIGGNHEGDFEYAKKLTQFAIDTDVDMVKFQIYTSDSLVSRLESPNRNRHFKKFELSKEQHLELAKMVTDAGLKYTSSVWDLSAIEWLDKYIQVYKIGSGDLTAYPVLRETAKIGKPLIVSTGLATEAEVLDTISFIQDVNLKYKKPGMLALLQCTSMYPIALADAHLNVMHRLRKLTGLTIGYSDHTEGSKALKYAVAMGAEVLEFHFTDERQGKNFRDHKVSLMPDEVKELIEEIITIREIQGNPIKKPTQIELDNGHDISFRRAVYPSRDIEAGELLSEDNLAVLRPNHGIDARDFDNLLGKTTQQDLVAHQKLLPKMIEDFQRAKPCLICGSVQNSLISVIKEKPELETKYLPDEVDYYREIRKCDRCGVYFNMHNYDLFNLDFYAGDYNAAIEQGKLQKRFERIINLPEGSSDNKKRIKRILCFCDLAINKKIDIVQVLDVGSGTGVFPYELSKSTITSAVDPDERAVKLMQKNINLENLWHGSLEDVPEKKKFDLITFNKVLEHLTDPGEMLQQTKSRLNPGGYLYIELPFAENIIKQELENKRAEFFIEHYTIFTFSSLRHLVESNGFESLVMKSLIEPSGKHTIYCFARITKS